MTHQKQLFEDTPAHIAALIIQHWRSTPPLEKLRQMSSLNASLEQLALAGLARQYPEESEAQLRERLHVRHYGQVLVDRVHAHAREEHSRT